MLQGKLDRRLSDLLEQASKDAEAQILAIGKSTGISSRVARAQLLQAQAELRAVINALWDAAGLVTRNGQQQAADLATEISWQWDQILLRTAYSNVETRNAMRTSLASSASRNVEAAIARITRGRVPLSARVYMSRDLASGLVEQRINSALARGANYRQLASDVRESIRPDTPGGVAYSAKRLARTEINAAYHAVTIEQNSDKPWNTGMAWRTSRSHPDTDICDLYESRSPYPLGQVPPKAHPNCLCYTYPETVSPDEWLTAYRSGDYDDYIARNYGRPTSRVA